MLEVLYNALRVLATNVVFSQALPYLFDARRLSIARKLLANRILA